jgi:hypothetical protein
MAIAMSVVKVTAVIMPQNQSLLDDVSWYRSDRRGDGTYTLQIDRQTDIQRDR